MPERTPHPSNVPGDFYVEDNCCTMCEVPFAEAPQLFGRCKDYRGYSHCFVKRQPQTLGELAKMLSAIYCAELMCIRYRGTDRRIQLELVQADSGDCCDHLPPDLQQRSDEREAERQRQLQLRKAKPWWKLWG